ncbi:prepilin-type N-terminal cleavage/methylation domain-containing protein [Candidatus Gottesmanbacteria bacterium]|nr:prepilin-type N-terminal cleavage/methylation domain-containing protein [Candidatus Gottesmanbacteria bacterium]
MKKGFTLMELLVVMAILGILITVGLTSYKSVQMKSRDSRRKSDMRQISSALELYFNDKGRYPADDGAGKIQGCGTGDNQVCAWGSAMKDSNNTIYMVALPGDPVGARQYYYDSYGSQGKGYQLYARLENSEDIDLKRDGSNNIYYYLGTLCFGTKKCNFGIASPNLGLDDASQGHTLTTTD